MTKFILVGGYVRKAADGGKAFCEELVRGFDVPVKILDCFFAEPEELWARKFAIDKEFFSTQLPEKDLELRMASVEVFAAQVQWADAIFLRGGLNDRLFPALRVDLAWTKHLGGKTLAGTSAGADALAKYTWGLDSLQLEEGLGLVPVKVLVHYLSDYNAPNIDWNKAEAELRAFKEDLPLVALREGEFKVFEK